MYYHLPGVQIYLQKEFNTFEGFASEERSGDKMIEIHFRSDLFSANPLLFTVHHTEMDVSALQGGWRFYLQKAPGFSVYLSKNRDEIICPPVDVPWKQDMVLPLLRTALECVSAFEQVVSLHAACVEMNGEAICFTAPSGVGKSTRAMQWTKTLGAQWISGDRPSIKLEKDEIFACGVPWDGKEKIYRNVRYPLKMICAIVRSDEVYARKLTKMQARKLLMQQCFIPMWDNEAAVAVMAVIRRLIDRVPVVELHCGPDAMSARKAYELIYKYPEKILEEKE